MKCALLFLETYDVTGGLQQFNRRVINNLDIIAAKFQILAEVSVFASTRDNIPAYDRLTVRRLKRSDPFLSVYQTLRSIFGAKVLILGHVNLLPIALLSKFVNPSCKVLMFAHGDEVWGHREMRPLKLYDKLLIQLVDQVVAVSEFTANVMSELFELPRSKFVILPNAVDPLPHLFSPTFAKVPGRLLLVSRMGAFDRRKNIDRVIRAMALVVKAVPQANLEVVGSGMLREELEGLANSLGLKDTINFRGKVTDTYLVQCYQEANVFVLPSSKEGFGIVFLEAWQNGLPVVCSKRGAPSEIINNGVDGIVVDEQNIEELAGALINLLSDPEGAIRMGQAGRVKVSSNYENATFLINFEKILRDHLFH